jgi:hypothetical protein
MNENMTPEAKAAVMALMGTTYGQMKQNDDMIVGKSGNLSPAAQQMQGMVKSLAQVPTISQEEYRAQQTGQPMPQPAAAPPAAPAPVAPAPVTPEQAMAELQAPAAPPLEVNAFAPVNQTTANVATVSHAETLEFDFSEPSQMDKLLNAVKESNLLLKDIKVQLEKSNVRPKRKTIKSKVSE